MQLLQRVPLLRITLYGILFFFFVLPNATFGEKLFKNSTNESFRFLEKIANAEKLKPAMKLMKKEGYDLKEVHTIGDEFWYEYRDKYALNTIGINISSAEYINAIKDAVSGSEWENYKRELREKVFKPVYTNKNKGVAIWISNDYKYSIMMEDDEYDVTFFTKPIGEYHEYLKKEFDITVPAATTYTYDTSSRNTGPLIDEDTQEVLIYVGAIGLGLLIGFGVFDGWF